MKMVNEQLEETRKILMQAMKEQMEEMDRMVLGRRRKKVCVMSK